MRLAIGVGAFCASLLMAVSALAGSGDTQLTSRQSNGGPGSNGDSEDPAASASGRFVAFESAATNLSGVDGPEDDVFLYDHKKRRVTLVSRRSKGGPGADGDSEDPSVSASGRFVAYKSDADNLSGADSDGTQDVFVYDRKTKRTSLVSRRSGKNGAGGDANSDSPSISADGRHVAFDSSADNLIPAAVAADNVFVYDRKRRRVSLVSRESNGGPGGDAPSSIPQISGNGRFVSFRSNADNLSGADVANSDVFVYDRKRRRVSLVSRESNGGPGADQSSNTHSISGDGRYIAYQSDGTNLSGVDGDGHDDVFVYDRRRKRVVLVSRESNKGARRRRPLVRPQHLGGRALRRLPVSCRQPEQRRCRRRRRRDGLRPRKAQDPTRLAAVERRARRQRVLGRSRDLGQRTVRRLRLRGDQSQRRGRRRAVDRRHLPPPAAALRSGAGGPGAQAFAPRRRISTR